MLDEVAEPDTSINHPAKQFRVLRCPFGERWYLPWIDGHLVFTLRQDR
jgi:hypothetical protein